LSSISADIGTITAGSIESGNTTNGVFITANGMKVIAGGVVRVRVGSLTNW
jgi:hypothetical protein